MGGLFITAKWMNCYEILSEMKTELFHQLVTLIHTTYTWVDVMDASGEETFSFHTGGSFYPVQSRVLCLVAKWSNYNYPKGHCWRIPEFMLDNAIRTLSQNPSFRKRCRKEQLLYTDAEAIIKEASFGHIILELET